MPTGHTPPGATLWPKGAPHLRPHRGGGPSPTGHLWPPPPPLATYAHRLPHWPEKRTAPIGKRGATPSPASHWPPTGHLLAIRGGPTGHPLAKRGREGATSPGPPPTGHLRPHWPSPALPHSPDFRERWPKGGGGAFRVQRVPIRRRPRYPDPLWGPHSPLPSPTDLPNWPPGLPFGAPSPTGWGKGGD